MKSIIYLFTLLISGLTFSQELRSLNSTVERTLDFGPEVQKEWAIREKAMEAMQSGARSWEDLTTEEKAIFEKYGEVYESMWDIIGGGCSWYCGAGLGKVTASSYLKSQGDNNYNPSNTHDLSFKTAWVEGVAGLGIGEYLEYTFPPENPRINKIIIVNGYVKSKTAWESNARVKRLKLYVNDKPFAYLNLKDVMAEQSFSVSPIGHGDRENWENLKKKGDWKLRFEIVDVYKGTKYDDVAITEIYFDGLDVHCLGKGTNITMSDSSYKKIEDLKVGDFVLSYNNEINLFEPSQILELANPIHDQLIKIKLKEGTELTATADHPFYDGKNWRSFNPVKTKLDYNFDNVLQLNPGDILRTLHAEIEIIEIEALEGAQETFTIVKLEKNNSFIANNVIVGTEELRMPTICRHNSGRQIK
ncbi:MAG TPA: hypothetical protein DIS90_03605 [Cytophagales bacterium]|nr:hypothetical protein [Cytophagales bacterium]